MFVRRVVQTLRERSQSEGGRVCRVHARGNILASLIAHRERKTMSGYSVITSSAALFLSLSASLARASEVQGTIIDFQARSTDGLHYLHMNGSRTTKPACATQNYFVIMDENSRAGQSQVAQILTAQATGRAVFVLGSGACTRWGDGEDVELIRLLP